MLNQSITGFDPMRTIPIHFRRVYRRSFNENRKALKRRPVRVGRVEMDIKLIHYGAGYSRHV
jgi:hypothetical protein